MDRVARRAAFAGALAALVLSAPAYAIEINQFPPAGPLSGQDIVPLYQGGTVRTTLAAIAAYLALQQSSTGTGNSGSTPSGLGTAAFASVGTSGAMVPLLNGTNTWSAPQTFTALTRGVGGHSVGTGDFTSSQQLSVANEDTTFACTTTCTATLPPTPVNGTLMHIQDVSGVGGMLVVVPSASSTRIVTPAGVTPSLRYGNPYQGASWVYHAANDVWVVE